MLQRCSVVLCFIAIVFSCAYLAVAFFVPVIPAVFDHTFCHMSEKSPSSSSSCVDTKERRHLPPGKLIVGYANWNQCDEKILEAVQAGVNVVIWFSINLVVDKDTGLPTVENGPDYHCVAKMIQRIRELNLPTTHLISIGGWNSPHPDTSSHSAETVFQVRHRWNIHPLASLYQHPPSVYNTLSPILILSPYHTISISGLAQVEHCDHRRAVNGLFWI